MSAAWRTGYVYSPTLPSFFCLLFICREGKGERERERERERGIKKRVIRKNIQIFSSALWSPIQPLKINQWELINKSLRRLSLKRPLMLVLTTLLSHVHTHIKMFLSFSLVWLEQTSWTNKGFQPPAGRLRAHGESSRVSAGSGGSPFGRGWLSFPARLLCTQPWCKQGGEGVYEPPPPPPLQQASFSHSLSPSLFLLLPLSAGCPAEPLRLLQSAGAARHSLADPRTQTGCSTEIRSSHMADARGETTL